MDVRDRLLVHSTSGAQPGGYLESLNLFRVLACVAVVANHSFIWANMTGNVIGTGFITLLHLSRNSFFFLSGLVFCYSQLSHPRPLRSFWRRRYTQLGVPYLAWTAIYLICTLITVSLSWDEVGGFLRQNLLMGYSQLYAAFVIFQFYFVFPLLLRLLRATRRHGVIMGLSLAVALILGVGIHYPHWIPALGDLCTAIGSIVPFSRDLLTYQEFFVAGALVAFHYDQVQEFVSSHYRQIFLMSGVVGVLTVLWYAIQVDTGTSVLQASDPYQSPVVIWYFAAIAAMFALSQWWEQRSISSDRAGGASPERRARTRYLAALTGGIWLSHNLFLTMLRSVLQTLGLRAVLPWEVTVGILFVGTCTVSVAFMSLILRTPLRWVLGGPVRSEQRAGYQLERPSQPTSRPELLLARNAGGVVEANEDPALLSG
jgi:peptidoglycan/LPS O-acetylase OafA/YrhL